jgi:Spy/CpxP family protein refolding chaperone
LKRTLKYLTFALLCAGLALAQRTPPDPAAMAQRMVEHLTQTLSLTSAQQAQATTIFTSAHTANQSVMAGLRQAHNSLAAAVKSNDANAISTLSAQIGSLTGQAAANTAKADAAFYAILTADQQAKYNPSGGFGGRGFGGPGGGSQRRRDNSPR